ncbi:MAG: LLM class flavin-dependent oxidoreductase [Acidimicrobiales bacterium]
MQPRRAIAFTPSHTDLDQLAATVGLAEELGYELACLPEAWCLDSTAVIAALAMRTEASSSAPPSCRSGGAHRPPWR